MDNNCVHTKLSGVLWQSIEVYRHWKANDKQEWGEWFQWPFCSQLYLELRWFFQIIWKQIYISVSWVSG